MYITENGCAYNDAPDAGGRIRDARRVAYLHGHIAAVHQAMQNGARVAGYFVWSLLDNYEWAKGYTQRFGIVWVDFETQQRIPKDSANWYARLAASGKLPDAGP
jgi:beta-glucosidase